jgi:hypothetical protein
MADNITTFMCQLFRNLLNLLESSKPVIGLYKEWFIETMTIKTYAHKIAFFIQTQHFSSTKIFITSNTMQNNMSCYRFTL